jgi:hypothetical protein
MSARTNLFYAQQWNVKSFIEPMKKCQPVSLNEADIASFYKARSNI